MVRRTSSFSDIRFAAAALRRPGDPNFAENKNQLRDGHVPHAEGFFQFANLDGSTLYADYEFLYARHSKYFSSLAEVKAVVELVLSKPERVQGINKNISFVGSETKVFFNGSGNPTENTLVENPEGTLFTFQDVSRVSGKLSNSAKLVVPQKADCLTIETSNSAGVYYQ